jgi:hypothetical protein
MMNDGAKNDDFMLARVLLGGFLVKDKTGLPQKGYLEKDTPAEGEARQAMMRVLRSEGPLDRDLREMLATLFDPDQASRHRGGHPAIEREITFTFPKGRRRNFARDTQISWHVWELVRKGQTVSAGIESAMTRYNLDESTVKKLWARYRRVFEAVWGSLK